MTEVGIARTFSRETRILKSARWALRTGLCISASLPYRLLVQAFVSVSLLLCLAVRVEIYLCSCV